MVEEYAAQLYEPAHQAAREMARDGYHTARERARWSAHVVEFWPKVRFVGVDGPQDHSVLAGRPVPLRASLDLAGLGPEDVRVEAVIGKIASSGSLEDTEIVVLPPVAQEGGLHTFSKEFVPSQTGRLGFSVRVSSNHFDDPITRPCHSLVKWGSGV
jgi:starch phosphorylase